MENRPKITVVTVTYNCKEVLQATIDSVVGQTYPLIEYLVIDGSSTDGTLEVIQTNESNITRWVSEPDKGIYDAMNKGIAMATGDYINFMNAGDMFYSPEAISHVVERMDPGADVVCGDTIIRSMVGEYIREIPPFGMLEKAMVICHQSALIRTELHKRYPYDTSFRLSGDYNFFYTSYKRGSVFQYIPLVIATFDAVEGVSSNSYRGSTKENARIHGVERTLSHKISIEIGYWWYVTKRTLKKFLPSRIMALIKRTTHHKWLN